MLYNYLVASIGSHCTDCLVVDKGLRARFTKHADRAKIVQKCPTELLLGSKMKERSRL